MKNKKENSVILTKRKTKKWERCNKPVNPNFLECISKKGDKKINGVIKDWQNLNTKYYIL